MHGVGSVATCVCRNPAHDGAMLFVCMLPVTTTPWPKAISFFFPVSVAGAGRAVGGVARHGNILAFLVAVCGLPTICLHAAAYLLSPFAPFRLLHKRACGWGVGTSRLRLVVTFYFCWRGCRSCLVFVV